DWSAYAVRFYVDAAHVALESVGIPVHCPLRDDRWPYRGPRKGSYGDFLLQERPSPRPRAVSATGRPPSGSERAEPVSEPEGRARPAQRGAHQDGEARLHHEGARPGGDPQPPGGQARRPLHAHSGALL